MSLFCFVGCVQVLVDDMLPVTEDYELYSASSANACELWVPLWEKAYAKLHGGYDMLKTISVADALLDLTGIRPFAFQVAGSDPAVVKQLGGLGLEEEVGTEDGFLSSLCKGRRWTVCRDAKGMEAFEITDCMWVEDGGGRALLTKLRSYWNDSKVCTHAPRQEVFCWQGEGFGFVYFVQSLITVRAHRGECAG